MEPMVPRKVLLVEDDVKLATLVREFLESRGRLQVEVEHRGDTAVERILSEQPALVILDIMLPGLDGIEVCRTVRKGFRGPILMLTALGDEIDEIVGLEVGADDYLAKPVNPRLLLTRVKALLRRLDWDQDASSGDSAPASLRSGALKIGELLIDPGSRRVVNLGRDVVLTTAEFDLLYLLASHAGEVISREDIYQELRGIDWDGLDRSIDQRIRRLREKLGDDARSPRWIKSVRGTGYLLAVTP